MGAQVIENQWGVEDSDRDDKRQVGGRGRERVTPVLFRTIHIAIICILILTYAQGRGSSKKNYSVADFSQYWGYIWPGNANVDIWYQKICYQNSSFIGCEWCTGWYVFLARVGAKVIAGSLAMPNNTSPCSPLVLPPMILDIFHIFWALEMLRIWYFWYGGPDIWHLDGVFNSLRISLAWQKNAKWQIKKDGPSISDCISVSTIYLLFHHPYSWCQRNCLFQKHCEKGPWTHITYSVHHRINLYEGSRVPIWC